MYISEYTEVRVQCMLAARVARALGCDELMAVLISEALAAHKRVMDAALVREDAQKIKSVLRLVSGGVA